MLLNKKQNLKYCTTFNNKILIFFKFIMNMFYGYENINIPNYLINAMNEDKLIEFFFSDYLAIIIY